MGLESGKNNQEKKKPKFLDTLFDPEKGGEPTRRGFLFGVGATAVTGAPMVPLSELGRAKFDQEREIEQKERHEYTYEGDGEIEKKHESESLVPGIKMYGDLSAWKRELSYSFTIKIGDRRVGYSIDETTYNSFAKGEHVKIKYFNPPDTNERKDLFKVTSIEKIKDK